MAEKGTPIEHIAKTSENLNSQITLLNQIVDMGCCVGKTAKNITNAVLGRNKVSTDRYTLVIKKTYVNQSGIEIEDSQKMEFGSKEEAINYVSKGVPEGCTWQIIDPPISN